VTQFRPRALHFEARQACRHGRFAHWWLLTIAWFISCRVRRAAPRRTAGRCVGSTRPVAVGADQCAIDVPSAAATARNAAERSDSGDQWRPDLVREAERNRALDGRRRGIAYAAVTQSVGFGRGRQPRQARFGARCSLQRALLQRVFREPRKGNAALRSADGSRHGRNAIRSRLACRFAVTPAEPATRGQPQTTQAHKDCFGPDYRHVPRGGRPMARRCPNCRSLNVRRSSVRDEHGAAPSPFRSPYRCRDYGAMPRPFLSSEPTVTTVGEARGPSGCAPTGSGSLA
jgi:hypothetical protein